MVRHCSILSASILCLDESAEYVIWMLGSVWQSSIWVWQSSIWVAAAATAVGSPQREFLGPTIWTLAVSKPIQECPFQSWSVLQSQYLIVQVIQSEPVECERLRTRRQIQGYHHQQQKHHVCNCFLSRPGLRVSKLSKGVAYVLKAWTSGFSSYNPVSWTSCW